MASVTLGLLWVVSCSSSTATPAANDASTGSTKGGVGSTCTASSDCTGYSKPTCLTNLKPLDGLITPDSGPGAASFATLALPFPGGYCSNTLADSCQTDADCGAGAGCYRPFEGVDGGVIHNLGALVPFDIRRFATEGLCLKTCDSASSCRGDESYKCIVPLHQFVDLFNKGYKKTFCVQDPDLSCYLKTCTDGG